jgi:hypothetical protein
MNDDGLARSLSRERARVTLLRKIDISCNNMHAFKRRCSRSLGLLVLHSDAHVHAKALFRATCAACRHLEAMHLVRLLPADSARLLPSAESSEGVERCELVTNPWVGEPALPR